MRKGLTIGAPISQYALDSTMFCPLHSNISKEQLEKYLCNSHYRKYRKFNSEMHLTHILICESHNAPRFQ